MPIKAGHVLMIFRCCCKSGTRGPKDCPRGPTSAPRGSQLDLKRCHGRPKRSQECSKSLPERVPGEARRQPQNRPKRFSRAPQGLLSVHRWVRLYRAACSQKGFLKERGVPGDAQGQIGVIHFGTKYACFECFCRFPIFVCVRKSTEGQSQ